MKIIIVFTAFILMMTSSVANAAAPNDISSNQRAWYDGVDIDGNNNYTDNPGNGSDISLWTDKSGLANHILNTGTAFPSYSHDTIGTQRHGVDFDGVNDVLIDSSDIWTGAVSQSETFIVATTDLVKNSSLFRSTGNGTRLGVHVPWGNSNTYFDQGVCCGAPTRMQGVIAITLNEQYFWHFVGLPAQQSVVRDGRIYLNDGGASTYNTTPNPSTFSIGGSGAGGAKHNGRVFEGIFYQTELNNAQRRIINSYLSAKWDKAFDAISSYADAYAGDDPANGNYDFFVGGIGQDNGLQSTGTSQGLTITDNNFLTADGKFVTAGVDYLVTSPTTGLSTSDLPAFYSERSNRTWYIDSTGSNGVVTLSFNATSIGIPIDNGAAYSLLHRTGISGDFTEVTTAEMSGGIVSFSHLPADGVYSVAKNPVVTIEFKKTNVVSSDPVNFDVNPKSIPGAIIDYTLTVKNSGYRAADDGTINISDSIPDQLVLFTGDLDGSGNPFIFNDNSCPPATNTINSTLTIDYPGAVVYKNNLGEVITPSGDFDSTVRSFELGMSGIFQGANGTDTPCFTIQYRTRIE